MIEEEQYDGIAIVGMAGRFPGAENVEGLWANLISGKESISFFSDTELVESGLNVAALKRAGQYVSARGVLSHADCFDAAFFGIHPKEAEVMDPQQRVFLEVCWEALERAGYAPGRTHGAVGVFAGATFNTYFQHVLQARPDLVELVGSDAVMFGNEKDYLTSRVAYKLGLKGPALSVSTACSTSLVAVCQAYQSLMTYQCDMALAGGVSITVPQKRGYYHADGNIASSDGHTRTFDAQATGTVFSNGVGVVVLKRLEEAVKDGDRIYAVIKGAAINNDGSHRVSFGAPGVEGQSEVIALAHAVAGVDLESITYVEAHGTATPLGDPIEVAALTKAFRLGTAAKQFCALGSVKTNIGHLDVASGVTGLIKAVLALHHGMIPASLHFTRANPKLDLENSPFYVNAVLRKWETTGGSPRRAGVSSFGTGGTNAHVVLEEAPELAVSGPSRPWQLLVLSTKTGDALDRATDSLSDHLKRSASDGDEGVKRELADTAFTLQTGRSEFVHRRILVCDDPVDGAAKLAAREPKRVFTHHQVLREPPVVFMFPGQGSQYPGMGAQLYSCEPVFRSEVDRCAKLLQPVLGTDVRSIVFPPPGSEEDAERLLVETRYTQPALFVIEYALAKLWMSWGVQPAAMIGHSVGEYVAGCLSGVFTIEDALMLVARRGALVQEQPKGAMLAVRLAENELASRLNGALSIAAINSPGLCVVAGPYDLIGALEEKLGAEGVMVRRLQTSHAFHSTMMEPVLAPFTELLHQVSLGEPKIPYVSNVTARWITASEARTPAYWAGHVRETVRFADGVAEFMKDAKNLLLEVGPGQTLGQAARQHPERPPEQTVLSSLPVVGVQEVRGILETLGRLWMTGVSVDWQAFYANERRQRIVLPPYPFERKRYWPASSPAVQTPSVAAAAAGPTEPAAPIEVQAAPMIAETVAPPEASGVVPRKDRLIEAARTLLGELTGSDVSAIDVSADLLELGLDSLLLTQAAILFQRRFGVSITFRQLMEELSSLEAIASHLDAVLPPEAFAAAVVVARPSQLPMAAVPGSSSNSTLEQLLLQQQQLTQQLLHLVGRQGAPAPTVASPSTVPPPGTSEIKSHGPFKPILRGADLSLSANQRRALESWIARYNRRTPTSKKLAAENRPVLADPRSVAGFKQLWKEMVYPIAIDRSEGSKIWDVDGNEYLDFVMGFGASLFGHRPPFVVQAVREQLDRGFEVGPIQPLAGEVARMIREFTGMQRVGFTNTGSEAVLAATRVARTVTGRDKVAVFEGAYHGIFDEVLYRPLTIKGEKGSAPIAPGIPDSALAEVIVLDYGDPESLEILRSRGSEIAAVLVEPVQSRRLDLQPTEFMHELRRITEQIGAALIFDEVVTGFRLHPGGAQAYFGVRADLATYGKVMGGGLPIGVVAGDAKFMDALDGGQWQYGDTSFPEVGVTFFAGTFVRHPLALAAAKAVLMHLKESGPALQQRLADRTAQLASQLRDVIDEFQAPYHLTQFSSLMQLAFPPEQKFAGLLYYLLRDRGIHVWDNRALVITTAHTDEDFARLIRALRESLSELRLGGFLAASRDEGPDSPTSGSAKPRANHIGTFPLTEAQKEIWLAAQMGGQAAVAYNESLNFKFRGPFDVEVFRAAARQVVQRHPILMGRISTDGQSQCVEDGVQLDLPLLDLSSHGDIERNHELEALIEREVSEPFDLVTGPLLRARIARMSNEYHVVIWTAHHIVCDGWSAAILVSELAKIYSALKQGMEPTLGPSIPFQQYALAAQADEPAVQNAMAYWRQQFVELPPPLDLPTDRPRTLVRSAKASTAKRSLSASLHQSLKRTAAGQRTTTVVLLMAGLKTLLYRLTGQTDLVVGLGVAGQAVTGNTGLVGHCVNLLPLRSRLQADASFQQNLAAVKKTVLDSFDHHECTIGGILQHLKVPRGAGRSPLVEVIFNVDRDLADVEFHGVEFFCERNPKRALHFDLFFNLVEGSRGLLVECDYNTDLFDTATIERWLKHFQTLLEGIASNPIESLGQIPLLTEAERRELTIDWNQTEMNFPLGRCLNEFVEAQVRETPDARAVSFEGQILTYAELNGRANQLAHYLRGQGVGPETLVAVCMERAVEMVVALLGIIKAGGAYVPLDPEDPVERLGLVLEDVKAPLVLTQKKFVSCLPTTQAVLALDAEWDKVLGEPDTNPRRLSGPQNAVYVIYTSGSTGKPKGVINIHEGIVNRLLWMQDAYRLDGDDRVLQKTPYTFDVSVWEFFWPLMTGACLVIAAPGSHKDPVYLARVIAEEQVTTLHFVPSMLEAFLEVPGLEDLQPLRVICSGEALDYAVQQRFFQRLSKSDLHNLYGPTEAAVDVTYWACRQDSPYAFVPIGRPVANTRIYVLDPLMNPVPVGVPGELHIGGVQVAREYLNRPELTAERFVSDCFVPERGGKLYKTGDLVRFLADGNIQYLGRMDAQVKVRGFRIEMGEIESTILEQAEVRQVVVAAREDSPGDKRLVAYIVAEKSHSEGIENQVRDILRRKLPDHMMPSAFVLVETLPVTSSGKINRRALPAPDGFVETREAAGSPRDALEQALVRLWSKILRVERVGLYDNFFELGGHSLLAVRVTVEIEKLYGIRLPLAVLIQAPTIAGLAEVLRQKEWKPSWSSLVPIRPGGSKAPMFLMHSHGGNVLEYYRLANYLDADQPVYALQALGLNGEIVRDRSLEEMAALYLREVRSLQPEGPYVLGGFCFGGLLALEAAQQLSAVGEQVRLVLMIQTTHPGYAYFRPGASLFHRWWSLASKRFDLERENLSYRGAAYIRERSRRIWEVARARTAIALDSFMGNGHRRQAKASLAFILESLGIEHDKAFGKYVPQPYRGDVVLFRAKKQLPGSADPSLGWRELILGKLDICEVPGHQQSMLDEPNVSRLGGELAARLEAAQRAAGVRVRVR